MTLPAVGLQISMSQVNAELNAAATTQISLNDTAVRGLAGKTINGSQIAMSDLQGKSGTATPSTTYSTNQANLSINVSTISGYVAGKSNITITINAGVYIYSTSTSIPAITITGAAAGDVVTLVNNGYIIGMGGAGGAWANSPGAGSAGGPALSLGCALTVTNYGYICGGGGGGWGGYICGGGGGAGGGPGGKGYDGAGGAGGGPGAAGSNGVFVSYGASGGGGGRMVPGTAGIRGTVPGTAEWNNQLYGGGGGAGGGSAANSYFGSFIGAYGGAGNAAGGVPAYLNIKGNTTGGGGWGANGGAINGSSAAGGAAIQKNGNTITWAATGTIYGAQV